MFGIDGKFYEIVSAIADLVILNLLFVLCSLPIFTIGASTTALFGVTKKMADNREGYIVRTYFKLFKENFKQSTAMWLILLMLSIIPTLDLYIVNSLKEGISSYSIERTASWICCLQYCLCFFTQWHCKVLLKIQLKLL